MALLHGGSPDRSICTVHGAYLFSSAAWRSKAYYALDYLTMFRSGRVVAVSAATAAKISRWARGDRVVVIHNGTSVPVLPGEAEKAAARRALGDPGSCQGGLLHGQVRSPEGDRCSLPDHEPGAGDSPDVLFLLVGDGGLRTQVETCARGFGPRVLMIGPQRDVSPSLSRVGHAVPAFADRGSPHGASRGVRLGSAGGGKQRRRRSGSARRRVQWLSVRSRRP